MSSQVLRLRLGDCIEVLQGFEPGSIGAVISDPPYLIGFMSKDWDAETGGGEKAEWHLHWLREVRRVLQPGGIIKIFSATRTFHRLSAAIEEAGFLLLPEHSLEAWCQGQGFPKYLNTSKAIDAHFGKQAEREVLGENPSSRPNSKRKNADGFDSLKGADESAGVQQITKAATPEAAIFEGWATALKPGWEPFVVGVKPA